MEAGTGIEPVFTDLQSNRFPSKINRVSREKFQDKKKTSGEHDTGNFPDLSNRDQHPFAELQPEDYSLHPEDFCPRAKAARALCLAVAECEPEDAAFVMSGILQRMAVGPQPCWPLPRARA